eukprot:311389-Chlamydomonas_euryale.AAC.1
MFAFPDALRSTICSHVTIGTTSTMNLHPTRTHPHIHTLALHLPDSGGHCGAFGPGSGGRSGAAGPGDRPAAVRTCRPLNLPPPFAPPLFLATMHQGLEGAVVPPDLVIGLLLSADLSPSGVTKACYELEAQHHPLGIKMGLPG